MDLITSKCPAASDPMQDCDFNNDGRSFYFYYIFTKQKAFDKAAKKMKHIERRLAVLTPPLTRTRKAGSSIDRNLA